MKLSLRLVAALAAFAFTLNLNVASRAEVTAGSKTARPLITQKIDDSKLVTREGNIVPAATVAKYDLGVVADNFPLPGITLQMQRGPEQEKAFAKLIDELHQPSSPNYHKWLSPQQLQDWGVSRHDVAATTAWLESHGFKVTQVDPAGMWIRFDGNAGQVREAFHAEIHGFDVKGEKHFANVSEPKIPAALAAVVLAPISLHNFWPKPMAKMRTDFHLQDHQVIPYPKRGEKGATPEYTVGSTEQLFTPGDGRTIYNVNPLIAAGYTGAGTSIGLIEDGDVYAAADYTKFVAAFFPSALDGASASNLSAVHPGTGCTDPGDVAGTDLEVELDVEYATAMAPAAEVIVESCSDTTTYGMIIALQNLGSSTGAIPPVLSMSYGIGETGSGATFNAAYNSAFQTLTAKGVSSFVSSGDQGVTTDDRSPAYGRHGNMPSGWSDSTYVVSVGGTDFYDVADGQTYTTYWNTTNGTDYSSAKSYIMEMPWNDTCANSVITKYVGGASTTPLAFCNTTTATNDGLQTDTAGSGGASNCYSGTATNAVAGSGTCAGLPKPAWQSVLGNPADGVRDQPDVSLFAANGIWGHSILMCYSNTSQGGTACTGAPSGWTQLGGTSGSSPMMAGIQALIDQYVGTTTNGVGALQGNPNWVYYKLASTEYGTSGNANCNSTLGNGVASTCIFYDVTAGDNAVACKGLKVGTVTTLHGCYNGGSTWGVSSTSTTADVVAYPSTTGWDFGTGIGTVNAYNLATNWKTAFPTTTALAVASATDSANGNDKLTATVSAATLDNAFSGGTQIAIIGGVTFYDGTTSIGTCTITTGASCSYTATGSQLTPGSNSITAVYAGNNAYPGSTSSASTITETDATTTTVSALPTSITTAQTTVFTATVTNSTLASSAPTGSVTFTLGSTSGTQIGSCTLSAGTCSSAAISGNTLGIGSDTVYANYAGVTNEFTSSSGSTGVTVSAAGPANGYLTFTAVSHNFGQVAVGTVATAFGINIKNTGTAAYPFVLNFTPANGFTYATNCPTSIAVSGSCELVFYFTPTSTAPVSATWSLASENGFGYTPSNGGTLTGSGTNSGGVSLTTNGHNFGTVTVGTTSPTYGTVLSNSTTLPITLTLGSVSSPFASITNCTSTLAAGASCNLDFTFTPTTTSEANASFAISATTTSSGSPVTITANGVTTTAITLSGN